MDYEAHWRAIYGAMRTALDDAGLADVGIYHIFTGDDSPLLTSAEPPLVVYRQDVERAPYGTPGAGSLKVLRSNWPMVSYAVDLADSLEAASAVISALTDATFTTTDGYTTTNIEPLGVLTLYEPDSELYATHFRLEWERSK